MRFLIQRDELVRALARVQNVVERRSTAPILSAVHLHAHAEGLRLTATDKAMTCIVELAATVEAEGEIALDAANLFQIVRVLDGDVVTFALGDNLRMAIHAGTAQFTLNGFAGEEFPVTPPLDQSRALTIKMDDLRRLLDQTLFAVAPDDNRYGLNGAHLEEITTPDGPRLRVVGTDGNRLCWSQAPFEGDLGIERRMLVPRKPLAELRKFLEGDGDVEVAFGERAGLVRFPGTTVHLRLMEAEFPDYRQVLPASHKRRVLVERDVLLDALRRVSVFAADASHSVQFAFGEDRVVLTSRKLDAGESREEVPVDMTGDPMVMGFNARYVVDVLSALNAPRIALELGEALSPCILRVPEDEDARFVVMPLRLD